MIRDAGTARRLSFHPTDAPKSSPLHPGPAVAMSHPIYALPKVR